MLLESIQFVLAPLAEAIAATQIQEWVVALAMPPVAYVVGHYFVRMISARQKNTRTLRLLNFCAPLISPLFAICLNVTALSVIRSAGLESALLLFMTKLSATWLAVRLIRQMIEQRIAGWFVALPLIPITILKLFGLLDSTLTLLKSLTFTLGSLELNAYTVSKGLIVLIALQWLASLTTRMVEVRLQNIKDLRASNRALIMKLFSILLYCILFLFTMQLLGINLTALGVFGGALGVGLGFGLQKIASNFISGIILLFEKSIEIGDLIEMHDGTVGYVRQTYARYTRLEMLNGKEILIPNEEFISQRVTSWTHTHTKAQIEITLSISYDADVDRARMIMIQAAEAYKGRLPNSETFCYLTKFSDNGLDLCLQFWIRDVTRGRMEPKSDVMLSIWRAFQENHIIIPYPQRQVHVLHEHAGDTGLALGAGDA